MYNFITSYNGNMYIQKANVVIRISKYTRGAIKERVHLDFKSTGLYPRPYVVAANKVRSFELSDIVHISDECMDDPEAMKYVKEALEGLG